MANKTSIEWTDRSANPIRARRLDGKNRVPGHFCQKCSSGCANCYSSNFQPRFGLPMFPGTNKSPTDVGVEVYLDQKVLQALLRMKKPCKIFLCDMTDVFGDWVPFEWIDQIFAVMALTPHLTYQILTKRPERMAQYVARLGKHHESDPVSLAAKAITETTSFGENGFTWSLGRGGWYLPNVWLGTSVEDKPAFDKRVPELLKCPAAVRFLSCEPLLGAIEFSDVTKRSDAVSQLGKKALNGIDWTIVGGESGGQARPFNVEWARSIVEQCKAADVACFVKQLGGLPVIAPDVMDAWPDYPNYRHSIMPDGMIRIHLRDSKGGDWNEWPEDLRVREFPAVMEVTR